MKYILTGDWHIRRKTPICRKSDIFSTVINKLKFIYDLAEKHQAYVLCAGDVFDKPSFTADTLNSLLLTIPQEKTFSCIGNHDVPAHRLETLSETALGTLVITKRVLIKKELLFETDRINFFHWGQPICPPKKAGGKNIAVCHVMAWHKEKPWDDCTDPDASAILKANPEYDLILTGHNHKTFVCELDGRWLVNAGGLLRLHADEINRQPVVFLYDSDSHSLTRIKIPCDQEDITNEHLLDISERDERIQAFVNKMKLGFGITLDFEENLKQFMQKNKTKESVKCILMEALHGR